MAVRRDLLEFFADRLKVALREKGVRHDLIAAVFALKRETGWARTISSACWRGSMRSATFLGKRGRRQSADRLQARRQHPAHRGEEGRRAAYDEAPDPALLRLPEESAPGRSHARGRANGRARPSQREAFAGAMAALARLRGPVDEFFDKVTVNSDDAAQRANRLRLLSRIRATLDTGRRFLARSRAEMSQWVYRFGDGTAEGRADMKNLLGGKGANLAEMTNLGLPVPPGFTITTEVCTHFYANGKTYPAGLEAEVRGGARRRRERRSGASSAMPTIRCWSRCARARAPRCRA